MNFSPTLFSDQRFAVVGLGRMGLPAAQRLRAMGAAVVAWDDNVAARQSASAAGLTVAMPDMAERFDALVLSPGIAHSGPAAHPVAAAAQAAGVPVLSDADLLFRAVRESGSRARFAGITGTNGKSTTTALLAHILEVVGVPNAAGANLGTAALALPALGDNGVYVLEMSSYMLERIAALRFCAAAMLNLSADHLDRHGDMAGYAAAKQAIFARQQPGDLAVIGIEDAPSRAMAEWLRGQPGRVLTISGSGPADIWADGTLLRDAEGVLVDLAACPTLPGAHNAQDAAAAAAMALHLGVARTALAGAMASYPGLPHRQELVATVGGIAFINDSKATNADSTARALGCHDRLIWIAGGTAKEGGIEPLVSYFPRVAEALLIGRDAPLLAATLAAHGVPHRILGTLEAATEAAWRSAQAHAAPVVLLSPACASWDQFTGYDQRGDRFRALAQAIASQAGASQAIASQAGASRGDA
jgi:UDP-N-acetylmuramoylalanine--D-glutamate ligase